MNVRLCIAYIHSATAFVETLTGGGVDPRLIQFDNFQQVIKFLYKKAVDILTVL